MNQSEIKQFLASFSEPEKQGRTIVIVDYGNVEKWKNSLGWKVGIKELGHLVKNFSKGVLWLRRFYYGADFGRKENSTQMEGWSQSVMDRAKMNSFFVVEKRVKYIHDSNNKYGVAKKCDLDVDMAIDLVRERDHYDTIILFSGDGDLMGAIKYLYEAYGKHCIVFGARNHIGREVFDAMRDGAVERILFAEDFEYRLRDSYRKR